MAFPTTGSRGTQSDYSACAAGQVQKARPDLRVIISSATMEAEALASYFDARTDRRKQAAVPLGDVSHAPAVLSVEGRTHDVKVCDPSY